MHGYRLRKTGLFPVLLMVIATSVWGQTETPKTAATTTYIVQEGDSLSKIAATLYDDASLWPLIYHANQSRIPNMNKISAGLSLVIPVRGQTGRPSSPAPAPVTQPPTITQRTTDYPQSEAGAPLRLVTGSGLSPLVDPSLPQKGMLAELVHEVFKTAKYDIKIKFWDWNDGLQAAQESIFAGTFPRSQTAESAAHFFASQPLDRVIIRAFVRQAAPMVFNTLQDLQGSTVCRPDGRSLNPLQPLIDQQQITLKRPTTLETCFNLLVRSEVDVVIANELVGESVLQNMALTSEVCFLEKAIAIDTLHVFFPKVASQSRALVYEFNQALGELERTGVRRDISRRHLTAYYQSLQAPATACKADRNPSSPGSSPVAQRDAPLEVQSKSALSAASSTPAVAANPADAAIRQPIKTPDHDSLSAALSKPPRDPLLPQRQHREFLSLIPPPRSPEQMELVSVPVATGPAIDGRADDEVWKTAPVVTTLDYASQRPITLQSVYTADEIFFLVTYPDQSPSETHKSWAWDAQESIYKQMGDREDAFVFKWSMVGNEVNLAFREAEPHRADVWFWKAHRTNQSGYADDKWHILTSESRRKSIQLTSPAHGVLNFQRIGDAGSPAYEEKQFYNYQGDTLPRYVMVQPQGSRADVRAKGGWHDQKWSLEFGRKLRTDQDDDVAFDPSQTYLFAVSCYEMAYGKVNPELSQPLYKTGDAFDRLFLKFARKDER